MSKATVICFCALFILVSTTGLFAGEIKKMSIEQARLMERLPVEKAPAASLYKTIPYKGEDASDSPGTIVGKTFYDYQTNGSTGRRIAKHDCGVHVCWMNGIRDHTGERLIYYNFLEENTPFWGEDGTPVSSGVRDGYTTMHVDRDIGSAIVAYHDANAQETQVAIDASCGLGLFTIYTPPNQWPGRTPFIWPSVVQDYGGRIHVAATEGESGGDAAKMMGHTFSDDGGSSWTDFEAFVEQWEFSVIVVASPVDDKAAIIWPHPIDFNPAEPNQFNNDIAYIESEDGESWDYENIINVTNYQFEDTIRAYCDVSGCYDYDGNLHLLWNTPGYWALDGTITADACFLWHWSEETGINMVYDAWHASFPGAWNRSASKMNISCASNNVLCALWTHFDDIDVSSGGFSNGELYVSFSTDGGITWDDPINVTDSPTPGCLPGDCDSDHWSSMAPIVDENLYISFIEDKDAGGIPQDEGAATQNAVRYLTVTNPYWYTSVDDNDNVPSQFGLVQNYPNPFNASTNIKYSLDKSSRVELKVYNLLGQEVATLVNGKQDSGEHTVAWVASDCTSGIYFYKLAAGDYSETRRMALIK